MRGKTLKGGVMRGRGFNAGPSPTVSEEGRDRLSGRFTLVGDVAVVSIPPIYEGEKREIGEAIISSQKNVKTVLNKVSKLEGDRRVASFELLAGGGTATCHREFGFSYKLDVAGVFFNPRLGSERMRAASKARAGEMAIVPFAGVGPFAVPVAAAGVRVVAVEISLEACRWLAENARLNRVDGNVDIVRGDAFALCRAMEEKGGAAGFDRAVIPTPYGRDEILDCIIPLVKPGGAVTFYTFKKRHEIEGLIEEFEGRGLAVEDHRRCGNVAPAVSRWAFDMVKL